MALINPLLPSLEHSVPAQEPDFQPKDKHNKPFEAFFALADPPTLYPLSVRVPEPLNDALDDAVQQTRRSMGRKFRKSIGVADDRETT